MIDPWIDEDWIPASARVDKTLAEHQQASIASFVEMEDDSHAVVLYPADAEDPVEVVIPIQPGTYAPGAEIPVLVGKNARIATGTPPISLPEGTYTPTDDGVSAGAEVVVVGDAPAAAARGAQSAFDSIAWVTDLVQATQAQVDEATAAMSDQQAQVEAVLDTALEKLPPPVRSTLAPTETDVGEVEGQVWWQYADETLLGAIQGQWVWDGTAWIVTPIASAVLENVTADKLRAGTGAIDTLFTQQFLASSAFLENLHVSSEAIVETLLGKTIIGSLIQGGILDGGLVRGAEFELKTEQAPSTSTVYSQDFGTATTDGWNAVKNTFAKGTYATTRVASGGRSGGALQVAVTGEEVNETLTKVLSNAAVQRAPKVGLSLGGEKKITMWVKATADSQARLDVVAYTASGVRATFFDNHGAMGGKLVANTWTKFEVVVPEGFATSGNSGYFQLSLFGGKSADITYLIDDITITTTYYGSQQIFIHQNDSGYPELVTYGADGESVVVSTRTADGYAGLSIYPADPQAAPSIIISQEGIGRVIYQQGTQLLSWTNLFKSLVANQFGSLTVGGEVSITGTSITAQPTIRMYRTVSGNNNEAALYITTNSLAQVGLATRTDGTLQSSLLLTADGGLAVQTFTGSPTANATRPLPFAIESGSFAATAQASSSASVYTITFASNRFTKAPTVIPTIRGTTGALRHTLSVQSVSSTQAEIRVANFTTGTGAAHTVGWIAIQSTV